jgi:large subunit ribosomal protein L3
MTKFILGKKLGMTTLYDEKKGALNVTLIECEPNTISLARTMEKDGYNAIQLKIYRTKNSNRKKEFRLSEKTADNEMGKKIEVDVFSLGDKVKISGITKAKGFQGVMKRHGFSGSKKTPGQKHDWRAPGSVGATYPEHVIKGKRMAGRMGGKRASSKNLEVVYIDKEKKLIGVKGAVPGVAGRIVEIIG